MVSPTPDLDELYHRYADRLYRYVRLRLPPADAEEVVSETFVTAWRRLSELPAEPEPWLLAVARRITANRIRAVNRREALWKRMVPRHEQVVPDHAEAVGEAELALRALRRLSKRDREILALLMSDLTPDQLGTILGCSSNAAAVRSHRARKRLTEAYAHEDRLASPSDWAPATSTRLVPPRGEHS